MKRSIIALISWLLLMLLIPASTVAAETMNKFENVLDLAISDIYVSPTFASDNTVFAISNNQLYRSGDGGKSWDKKALVIDNASYPDRRQNICSVFCEGNGIVFLSGTYTDINQGYYVFSPFLIKSTDGGNKWYKLNTNSFYNLLSINGTIFGISAYNLYLQKSLDNGLSWNWNLTSSVLGRNYVFASTDGENLWTIYDKKLWHSKGGNNWKASRNINSDSCKIFAYGNNGEHVLLLCSYDKVVEASISTDNGFTWEKIDFSSVPRVAIYSADIERDGLIVMSTEWTFVYVSNNYGKSWEVLSEGLPVPAVPIKCALQGDSLYIFAGTGSGLFRLQYPLKEEISNPPTTASSVVKPLIMFFIGEKIYLSDNKEFVMDIAPFVSGGRTFVPLKYLAEALGAKINWDQTSQSISITKDQTTVVVEINKNVILINGQQKSMDVKPIISNERTFLPAKYIADAFGYSSSWDATQNSIILQ